MVRATRKLFVPPILSYIEEFEHETKIWQCLTDLEKEKRGPAIYLSLNEKIRKTCSDIKVKDLNSEDGVNILIKKLKSLFPKDTNQAAYLAYDKFKLFKRPVNLKGCIIRSRNMKWSYLQKYWHIDYLKV